MKYILLLGLLVSLGVPPIFVIDYYCLFLSAAAQIRLPDLIHMNASRGKKNVDVGFVDAIKKMTQKMHKMGVDRRKK